MRVSKPRQLSEAATNRTRSAEVSCRFATMQAKMLPLGEGICA
jgi:hypothetical protein